MNGRQTPNLPGSQSNNFSDKPLILDLGTQAIKVGFSELQNGDRFPQMMIPTLVGFPKITKINSGSMQNQDQTFVGLEALKRSPLLCLKYPIEHGIILDWDEIDMLINHCVNSQMKVNFSELHGGLMMSEAPLNPKRNREKLAELVFEKYQVPKFQISMQSLNALYAEGLHSGLVLECGEGISTCVPIVEGYVQSHAIQRLDIGGRDINEYLMDLLKSKVVFTTTFEREFVRDIKEQCCSIKTSTNQQLDRKKYSLPDGKSIEISNEQFDATEILFNSSLIGKDGEGLQHLVLNAIEKCEIDTRKALTSNLILAGGSTMFKGFSERLYQEIGKQAHLEGNNYQFNIIEKPYRRYTSWIGASILASLSSFQPKWITKSEFEEHGVAIVHKKSMIY
eukprot:403357814